MVFHRLHTSEHYSAYFTWILPLCTNVRLIFVAGQKFLGNAGVPADITNVLWLPNMHHIFVVLQVWLVDKGLIALVTLVPLAPLRGNFVHHQHVLVHEPGLDFFPTDLADFGDVAPKVVDFDIGRLVMPIVTALPRAEARVLLVGHENNSKNPACHLTGTLLLVTLEVVSLQKLSAFETESPVAVFGIVGIRAIFHVPIASLNFAENKGHKIICVYARNFLQFLSS